MFKKKTRQKKTKDTQRQTETGQTRQNKKMRVMTCHFFLFLFKKHKAQKLQIFRDLTPIVGPLHKSPKIFHIQVF